MIEIDGSFGEGGGQILRTALALSAITGTPVEIHHVRARRSRPGLQRQHLAAVHAVAEVCGAELRGDELGSQKLSFVPGRISGGEFVFDVGSAGSTTLVLATVLPALLEAESPSTLEILGGTHNPLAPPFEFLRDALAPCLARIGIRVAVTLERHGFYPQGGGGLRVDIQPWRDRRPLELEDPGSLEGYGALAISARLPAHVGERELATFCEVFPCDPGAATQVELDAPTPANVFLAWARHAHALELVTSFGARGKPAERVARDAVRDLRRFERSGAAVGEHLADQLVLPLALGRGGRFTTVAASPHLRTNAATIARFLGECVHLETLAPDLARVTVDPRSA